MAGKGKNPAFMYYPKDWRADAVFGCSLAARGLWHEMMNMMHSSERYGYLSNNGLPIPDEAVARYCGCSLQEYQTLLAELFAANVPRRTNTSVIYSKRMVEDHKKREEWKKRQNNHRDRACDVTHLSRECHADLHSAFPSAKRKTPLPPATAGDSIVRLDRYGEVIVVEMGKKTRLLSKSDWESVAGQRAEGVVRKLQQRGFKAWVEQPTLIGAN